jgi:hypothetical protein
MPEACLWRGCGGVMRASCGDFSNKGGVEVALWTLPFV